MSLFLNAIQGNYSSRPPVWMMRQAGRYLPEYQELRKKTDFLTMVRTPELACEVSLQPIRRFNLDACVFFSDILTPLVPMGANLSFQEGEGPHISNPIRTPADIKALKSIDPKKEVAFVAETLQRLRQELSENVALIGFAGAPFTLAAYLIEGGGSKHFVELHRLMYQHPESFQSLMDKLSQMLIDYLKMQIDSGAQALQLFDTWGGVLSLEEYRRYALPSIRAIFSALKPSKVPLIFYLHQGSHLLPVYLESGADVASLDWRVSLKTAKQWIQGKMGFQGNLNPLVLFGPRDLVQQQTREILAEMREPQKGYTRFIFNLGHGILPKTPIESITAMLQILREESL
ncbi:MAG: uroporphyrinogen decarboxylase [Planctomycetota bacterium]